MRIIAALLTLFVVVPLMELALLIQIGKVIGTLATVALVIFTGVLGATLARWQGLGVVHNIRTELANGKLPAGSLVDGALILIAAAVLMTPGVLTDLFGFFCLIPAGRALVKGVLSKRFAGAVRRGTVTVSGGGFSGFSGSSGSGPSSGPAGASDAGGRGGAQWVRKPPMRNVTPTRSDQPDRSDQPGP